MVPPDLEIPKALIFVSEPCTLLNWVCKGDVGGES